MSHLPLSYLKSPSSRSFNFIFMISRKEPRAFHDIAIEHYQAGSHVYSSTPLLYIIPLSNWKILNFRLLIVYPLELKALSYPKEI